MRIRQALVDLSRQVLRCWSSPDLDELSEICDRIAVMHRGHYPEAMLRDVVTAKIGLMMGGAVLDAY